MATRRSIFEIMKKTKQRICWWIAVVAYIALIYSTLGVAPQWWDAIDAAFGGKGMRVLHVLYAIMAVAIFLYLVYIKRENSLAKYFWFFLCVGVIGVVMKSMPYPAEKIHFAEYGLLGVLLYNALKIDVDCYDWKLYFVGVLLCVAIGAMDEVIQLILPNRYFDWRDLFVNGTSGAIALCLIRLSILREEL